MQQGIVEEDAARRLEEAGIPVAMDRCILVERERLVALGGQEGEIDTGFFFSSRSRNTRSTRDWSSDVCSSDLSLCDAAPLRHRGAFVPGKEAAPQPAQRE